ncbi:MAG: hypothetical protein FJ211_10625 [Ignavibacteria bacterium]|nr:hypothetical protein [Ignavibacteria bacterium]
MALAVPGVTIFWYVVAEWQSAPSQRGWLVLGLMYYILAALRVLWESFVQVCERALYLRLEVRRFVSPTLFEAVTDRIAEASERLGLTCSWDQEAIMEHNRNTEDMEVKLRFWSSRPRSLQVGIALGDDDGHRAGKLDLNVHYSPGEDVISGRDARVERQEVLVLSLRTSAATVLSDKALLTRWFEQCCRTYTQPDEGTVNVYALQETSSDWIPEWKLERVKSCKSASGIGQRFFLERACLGKVLADARLWASSSLRVYMINGPPGVGKSEFTIWLASQLRLPVYRLCLSSPLLTDGRLAQLLSHSAVKHNIVLVQLDEFQGTIARWLDGKTREGVTPGGFCECLQGSTAMGRGIVVLTGTLDTAIGQAREKWPAVFRRIHWAAELGWMSHAEVGCFFRKFLARFVLGMPSEEWGIWEAEFLRPAGPWAARNISVDMLKQYLMQQITESSCRSWGGFTSTTGASQRAAADDFRVHHECRAAFFALICDHNMAALFLNDYAPVSQVFAGEAAAAPCEGVRTI